MLQENYFQYGSSSEFDIKIELKKIIDICNFF